MATDEQNLMLHQPTAEERALFEFYKKNPDMACIDLLNQDLAPFQRLIIKGIMEHSYIISVLSRGSGKTRMIAMCAAIMCMFNPKIRVGFIAPGFRQSKLAFMEFLAILEESPHLQACVKNISRQTDMWSVEFWNGAFIFALPLSADSAASIRGTRLHVAMIDEYPHVPKAVLDLVINPMLATQRNPMLNVRRIQREKEYKEKGLEFNEKKQENNKICGFSSAYFQFNHMYKTICDYRKFSDDAKKRGLKSDYAAYVFNYLDAPDGFFDMKMIEHAKATSSSVAFAMEYLSEFPADSDGFFKRSLIESCKPANGFYLEAMGEKDGRYFLGIDPARTSDAFAITILKISGDTMRVVRTITFENTPFPETAQFIRELLKQYNIVQIGMDAGGGGLAMKDLLANPMTAANEQEILLDADDEETIGRRGRRILKMHWVSEANFDMRASLEHKKLLFPDISLADTYIRPEQDESDIEDTMLVEYSKLLDELQSIVMTATKGGTLHFDTPNTHMRKDRYSSLLVGHRIAYNFLKSTYVEKELAGGALWTPNGIQMFDGSQSNVEDNFEMTQEELMRRMSKKGHKTDLSDGALVQ
jgi:hypothetical protein